MSANNRRPQEHRHPRIHHPLQVLYSIQLLRSLPTQPEPSTTPISLPKLKKFPYINSEETFEISPPIDWAIVNINHTSVFSDPNEKIFFQISSNKHWLPA